jgi:hypothetical protein
MKRVFQCLCAILVAKSVKSVNIYMYHTVFRVHAAYDRHILEGH